MERLRYITICLLTGFIWVSCTKAPVFQESLVPEIISITSIPETHSAVLISDLNTAPYGRIECGFYFGADQTNLRRVKTSLSGRTFTILMDGLDEGTIYYFKAFIGNGINEIASGFESFVTDTEPVLPVEPDNPEQPVEPDQPDDPGQDEPEDPVEPEQPTDPEPEDPVEPEDPGQEEPENPEQPEDPTKPEEPGQPEEPVEFTTEIASVSAAVNDYIAELTAELSGDVSLVTECWFMAGYTPDKLSKIKGTLEGTAAKAYLAGLE
ncbi:MAG: hypothetical protein IJ495_00660, partial [Bacteroidales bacterium]|nr:hypothetical protein [Bacteroidales bacterium]